MQRQVLRDADVGVIFEEKASGTKRDGRTELQKVLSALGNGDALVVTRLDRLGRSLAMCPAEMAQSDTLGRSHQLGHLVAGWNASQVGGR